MFHFFLEAESLMLPDSVQKAQWKEWVEHFTSLDAETFLRNLTGQAVWVAVKLAAAVAIYVVGKWLIQRLIRLMDHSFDRRHVDESLRSFLRSLVKGVVYAVLILIVVQMLGFNTTSLVALVAASGFGIGMALSGTLQNFAGGVMIMFMQPYRIGDYIEAQGQAGTVKEIRLFSTVITTTDNKRIYIPNTSISNAIVNNYSAEKLRRVEWNIAIAYGDDVATARSAILDLLKQDKRVLTTPKAPANPFVGVAELADSSVNLVVRAWVASADYWDVFYEKNELFYTQLPDAGIHFPYPQLDVHVEKADA
jgi:small conductance mechanosensitive channel